MQRQFQYGQSERIPIIQAVKQWAIKGQQFPDRSTTIFGAPGAGSVWYERSIHLKKRPIAQGIISSRFYQKAVRDSIWQLTYGQKAVLTAGNDPWKHVRPHARRDWAEMSDNTSFFNPLTYFYNPTVDYNALQPSALFLLFVSYKTTAILALLA